MVHHLRPPHPLPPLRRRRPPAGDPPPQRRRPRKNPHPHHRSPRQFRQESLPPGTRPRQHLPPPPRPPRPTHHQTRKTEPVALARDQACTPHKNSAKIHVNLWTPPP